MAQAHSETQQYQISKLNRLKRFCVLGSETSTYEANCGDAESLERVRDKGDSITENLQCVQVLLDEGRYEEVIRILKEYSLSGRVAKEDPILTVLAICSVDDRDAVRKEALNAVVDICNIPTKLFRFLELSQKLIDKKRETKKPKPQPKESAKKRKIREETQDKLESLNLGRKKDPSEPPSKKAKKKKNSDPFKPINPAGKKTSGWGRMRRKAIGKFYSDEKKDACRLLYLMTKYKQRHGWCHKDVLVYSHPKVTGKHKHLKDLAIKYCTKGMQYIRNELDTLKAKPGIAETESLLVDYIEKLETVHNLSPESDDDKERMVEILRTHGVRDQKNDLSEYSAEVAKDKDGLRCPVQIVREHLPSGFLNSEKVWECLLQDMPMTSLLRNLRKMTRLELFNEPENLQLAVKSLTDAAKLKKARVHPIKILKALEKYRNRSGVYTPKDEIVEALDEAYHKSFMDADLRDTLRTNKKYMLCIDVSESMFDGKCVGCKTLTPALASFAMAWVRWHVEDDANVNIMVFNGSTLRDLKGEEFNFRKDMKLAEVIDKAKNLQINAGVSDYSLPIYHAQQNSIETDAFIIYTDNVYTDANTVKVDTVAANTVNVDTIAVKTVNVDTIAVNTVNVDTIAVNTVNVDAIAVNTVNVDTIAVNTVNVDTIAVNTVNVDTNDVNPVNVDTNDVNPVNVDTVAVNTVNVDAIAVNTVNVDTIAVNTVNVDTIAVNTVNVNTVNEVQDKRILPEDALRKYNTEMGRNAKLIVVGMTSNGFTIADPDNQNMLDVVGFDAEVPNIISMFVQDEMY